MVKIAYTATYTTTAIVRSRAENIGAAAPSDAEITEFIGQAQQLIDGLLRFSLMDSFDENKHGIVKMVCTDIAAFYAIAHDPSGFTTVSEAALILDIIYTNMVRGIELLRDDRIRTQLKEA